MIDLSVVTFDAALWLRGFFDSLLAQRLPTREIRVLVRDNGSRDETLGQLTALRHEIGSRFAEFLIDSGPNVGFGRGHNANLGRAASPFFLVSNVDLEFEPDTLIELLAEARRDAAEVAAWECRQKPYEHPKHYDPVTGRTLWCSSACVMYRTEALRAIGGYEPRLFLYGEDVEISYRLRDHGHTLRYVPRAGVLHHAYRHAGEVKPAQFLGSTLANVLLRCRYGSAAEVVTGFTMYLGLLALPERFAGQRRGLLVHGARLLWLAPQFLATRRRSAEPFPFRLWDYEFTREGAFHPLEPAPASAEGLPLVSLLVRTMPGRAGKLREALASVAAQTYPRVELVLVEDGGETARDQAESLRAQGRLERVIYRPLERSGRCRAGNAALEAATGTLACFLDDDDLLYADHLEVLVAQWRRRPDLGAVYGLAYEVRTRVKSEEPWIYQDLEHRLVHRQPFSRPLLWHHNFMPIQTVLFQRRLFLELGGFDPGLDNLEDWNLWVRYSLHQDFEMVPKVTSLYRVPADTGSALQRQQVLDDYYAQAQARHAHLRLELSPPEVLKIAEQLSRELFVAGLPVARVRRGFLAHPWLSRLYHPARRLYHLLRRLRAR